MAAKERVTVQAENLIGAEPGDRVVIEAAGCQVFSAILLVYALPIILFFDFESGKVFKPFAKKRNVIYSNPVYAEGFYYFLQGDYDEKKISLYRYIPGKLLEKETELSTEEVSLYNLCIIGNPVHIISQEDTFVCYYPEKISFPITGHESALFIEDEKIYFESWVEEGWNDKNDCATDLSLIHI